MTTTSRQSSTDGVACSASLKDLGAELAAAQTVILDTSVLMADPEAHLGFAGADVVIPLTVIDELDKNKARNDDAGRNARTVLRHIEDLRLGNNGDISTKVDLPNGGTLRIEPNGLRLEELTAHHLDARVPDHRILAAALGVKSDGGSQVALVSNDTSMRIKAAVLGLSAREWVRGSVALAHSGRSLGYHTVDVSPAMVNLLFGTRGEVALSDLSAQDAAAFEHVRVNEFVVVRASKQSALARMGAGALQVLPPGESSRQSAWGMKPRSKEQSFALSLLLDPDVPLVALEGRAGTGKTALAIAAGLEQTFEKNLYSRMTILRPVISVGGQDIGFLPGDVADKLGPWFECVVDTMVALSGTGQSHRDCRAQLDAWVDEGRLTLEPVTYLRGRSLVSTYCLTDEVQNLESSTVRTIITRLGKGSKGVLTGDTTQIDSPWTSERTNGLTALVEAFAGEPEFGHVVLTKGERSRIADMAAERL